MSPVSSSKVSAPAATRVQAPFTLSDTWLSPGALYCENHPTSRSPWATGRVSAMAYDESRAVENAVAWTKVGVASAACGNGAPRATITARPDTAEDRYFTRSPFFCTTRVGRLEPDQTGSSEVGAISCGALAAFPFWMEAPTPQRSIAPLRAQRRGRRGARSPCHIASRNPSNRRAGPIGLPGYGARSSHTAVSGRNDRASAPQCYPSMRPERDETT